MENQKPARLPAWANLSAFLPILPILLGLAALYGPSYDLLAASLWQESDQAHVPLVALVVAGLFWQLRQPLAALPIAARPWLATLFMLIGLVILLSGQSVESAFMIMLSQIPLLAGILLFMIGMAAVRVAWFPLLFLVFMVPVPGMFIDALTGHLKEWISLIVENLLYWLDYPVARNGVVLTVGKYRMLVADACSGLHSMVSLTALGSLFIYLIHRPSWRHNTLMMLSVLPIAFAANLLRVLALVLITYHFGDAMGRVVHEATGTLVFIAALILLFGFDALLVYAARLLRRGGRT